MGNKERT